MIIANVENDHAQGFESILGKAKSLLLKRDIKKFKKIQADAFEEEVLKALKKSSRGTIFEGTIEYVGGKYFPDIIAGKKYGFGVEVKKVASNSWATLGNSIMESTRIKNIDKVYIFFGKLGTPVDFKFDLYENCLSDVVISHSPRYQVDMNINLDQTIFKKMGVSYEKLRKSGKPFLYIKEYLRDSINENEEPWWLEKSESRPYTRLWKYLPANEKKLYLSQMMGFFPQIFGNRQDKYNKSAAWLASRHGVINPSFRDCFSAGGREDLKVDGRIFREVPKIFKNLQDNAHLIKSELNKAHSGDIHYYLNCSSYSDPCEPWIERVVAEGKAFLEASRNGFINFPLRKLILEALEGG